MRHKLDPAQQKKIIRFIQVIESIPEDRPGKIFEYIEWQSIKSDQQLLRGPFNIFFE